MQERIVDIIILLLRKKKKKVDIKNIDLSMLSKKGYSPTEIGSALVWLEENIDKNNSTKISDIKNDQQVFRILHQVERSVIKSSAYGYLVELKELEIINEQDLELIIDRLMLSDLLEINLNDMKSFASSYIMEKQSTVNKINNYNLNNSNTIH